MLVHLSDRVRKLVKSRIKLKVQPKTKCKSSLEIIRSILQHINTSTNTRIFDKDLLLDLLDQLYKENRFTFEFDASKRTGYYALMYFHKLLNIMNVDDFVLLQYTSVKKKEINLYFGDYLQYLQPNKPLDSNWYSNILKKIEKSLEKRPIMLVLYSFMFKIQPNETWFKTQLDLRESIEYNENIYKLEAIIIRNYNIKHVEPHLIACITCNDERYIYNGWRRKINKQP